MSVATRPPVGLITIWYRAGHEMQRFLADLRALQYPNFRPVFVIHHQTAEEVACLRAAMASAHIIELQSNPGCGAGWNRAIRYLLDQDVSYIGVWNTDVRLAPDCLDRLIDEMEADPSIGACQPVLLYSDAPNTVEMFGGAVDLRAGVIRHEYAGVSNLAVLPRLRDAQYLDGGSLLVRSNVLRQVDGFDEKFFLYAEDTDFSSRVQQAGYRTVAVRDARAWHFHRERQGRMPAPYQLFYQTRNRFYLVGKHAGASARRWLVLRTAISAPRMLLFYLRYRKLTLARAYLAGLACGALGLMGKRGWVE